jgi:hypothetical protein
LNRKQVSRGCCPTTGATGGHYRSGCFLYAECTEVDLRLCANFVAHIVDALEILAKQFEILQVKALMPIWQPVLQIASACISEA